MISSMITAVTAFLIDALIGDPRSKFHPVVLIGNLISFLEKIFRRDSDGYIKKICKGGVLVTLVLAISYGAGVLIFVIANLSGYLTVKIFVEALVLSFMISPRSLADAGREIYFLLNAENLIQARKKVGWIVGRDTDYLNEAEVVRATVC